MSKTMQNIIASDALFDAHIAECIDTENSYIFYHRVSDPLPLERELDSFLRVSLTPRREILVPIHA